MIIQPVVLRPDQHEPALNVVGTQVTVLASNEATKATGLPCSRARREQVLHRIATIGTKRSMS